MDSFDQSYKILPVTIFFLLTKDNQQSSYSTSKVNKISTSYIRRRGSNQFSDKSKNAIGIGAIWTQGCSETSDAANPPATTAGFIRAY